MVLICMNPDQIGLLIEKYALGIITPEETRLLMDWYKTIGNQDVVWPANESGEKESVRAKMLARLQKSIGAQPTRVISISFAKVAAAIVAVVGLTVLGYYFSGKNSTEFYTVTNSHEKVQLVLLPDSSRVWLNAATTLRYHPSFNEHRELELSGEAFFEVTKDPDHPFAIKTGEMTTTVVGTSFNVSAYNDDEWKVVSVITGKVRVNDADKELALLTPAKSLRYSKLSKQAMVLDTDTVSVVSWTRGKLQFAGKPLSEITKLLERRYGYSFTFGNRELENCRYYLNLSDTLKIDEVMNVLREAGGLQITINQINKSISINGTSCQ